MRKKDNEELLYVLDGKSVLVNIKNLFIYETNVYSYHKGLFGLSNSTLFSSTSPIIDVVNSFWITPNIQMCSELYSAPEQWLRDNKYKRYIKPDKVEKIKLKPKASNE